MKNFKVVLFFMAILNGGMIHAQTFKVLKATKQPWSGGVAGHYGADYDIELETSLHTIVPDTMWINDNVYPLSFSTPNNECKRTVDSVTHRIKYSISATEAHDEMRSRSPNEPAAPKSKYARHFQGAGMISYQKKHKQYFFIIKSFTVLDAINYP